MATCPECRTTYADDVAVCKKDGAALVPDKVLELAMKNELTAGTMVGEYRIEAKIGEGGFGAVYRAIQPVIGKAVAIKILSRAFSEDARIVSRFVAEARAVNQIRNKNIVDIFSFGALPDGRQYFVMELLHGLPLDAYLAKKGYLEVEEMVPIMSGILRALAAAHGKGLAHRDLKPENVFMEQDDEGGYAPKLIDFGIVKLLGDDSAEHKTRTGTPIGTPYFMSPEQCRGKNVDHRTDIYSLGAMIHVLCTGKRPFVGDSAMDVLFKQMTEPPPRLSAHRAGLPRELEDLVLKMLSKDPAKRPQTALETLRMLELATGHSVGRSSLASLPSVPQQGSRISLTTEGESEAGLDEARTIASDIDGSLSNVAATGPGRKTPSGGDPLPAAKIRVAGDLAAAATAIDSAPKPNRTGWMVALAACLVAAAALWFIATRMNGASDGNARGGASTSTSTTSGGATATPSPSTDAVSKVTVTPVPASVSPATPAPSASAESSSKVISPGPVSVAPSSKPGPATSAVHPKYDPNDVTF